MLSAVGFPYLYLSMIFVPILELSALGVGLVYSLLGLWKGILIYLLAAIIVEFICSIIGIFVDEEDRKLIALTPIYVLFYRYLIDLVRMKCYWDVFTGKLKWTKSDRYGGLDKKIDLGT